MMKEVFELKASSIGMTWEQFKGTSPV